MSYNCWTCGASGHVASECPRSEWGRWGSQAPKWDWRYTKGEHDTFGSPTESSDSPAYFSEDEIFGKGKGKTIMV